MTMRTRKLIGAVLLILMVTVYALIALAVAVVLQVRTQNPWVELLFYAVAGLAWVIPAAWLVSWMSKADEA